VQSRAGLICLRAGAVDLIMSPDVAAELSMVLVELVFDYYRQDMPAQPGPISGGF
jgi:hypothetical protein